MPDRLKQLVETILDNKAAGCIISQEQRARIRVAVTPPNEAGVADELIASMVLDEAVELGRLSPEARARLVVSTPKANKVEPECQPCGHCLACDDGAACLQPRLNDGAAIRARLRGLRVHWSPEVGHHVRLADLSDALGFAPGELAPIRGDAID